MLENYVNPEDIPLIQSLAISQGYHRDEFCWNYTKNGKYTVKSGYWVARNLLNKDKLETQIEPNITKLLCLEDTSTTKNQTPYVATALWTISSDKQFNISAYAMR